jgi:hypothetical protein
VTEVQIETAVEQPLAAAVPLCEGINIFDESRSSISDQQHPIADLEHPFALINTSFIAKGCSKLRIGDG